MKEFLNLRITRHFGPDDLQTLMRSVLIRTFQAGAAVCREGEPAEHLFIMRSGEATVVRRGRALGILQKGDLFGEGALLEERRRLADVIARSDASVYCLPEAELAAFLARRPRAAADFLMALIGEFALRLRNTTYLLGTIADVGQAVAGRRPLAQTAAAVIGLLRRDVPSAAGAAAWTWNPFTRDFDLLHAEGLEVSAADCTLVRNHGGVVYLDRAGTSVAGICAVEAGTTVGVLFLGVGRGARFLPKAEEIVLETVAQQFMQAVHRDRDHRDEVDRERLRNRPNGGR